MNGAVIFYPKCRSVKDESFYPICKIVVTNGAVILCVLKQKNFSCQLKISTWMVKPKEEVNDEEIAGPGLF